jgi:hypothetical protein
MALDLVLRHSSKSANTIGANTYTTSAFTTRNSSLQVVIGAAMADGVAGGFTGASITGATSGPSLTAIGNTGAPPSWYYGLRAWYAQVATGASTTLDLDCGATSIISYGAVVLDFTGHDTTTPIVGFVASTDSDGNGTLASPLTLGATPTVDDYIVAVTMVQLSAGDNSVTPGSGFTELYDATENSWWGFQVQTRTGTTSTSVDWVDLSATGTPVDAVVFAFIVKASTGASPTVEQEGFRFGEDDGSESAHTWAAAQDANISSALSLTKLIRFLLNGTLDPASASFKLKYQKNGSGGYADVPVGATIAEDIGTVAYDSLGAGANATSTTSITVAYPTMTGATAKTALYLIATGRSNTADTEFAITGGGWSIVGTLEGGTGTWGVDTGTRRVTIFRKDSVTGSESGSVTLTLAGTTANTLRGSIVRVDPPTQDHTIEESFASGADTTNGTGYSATAGANQTYLAGDLLLLATAQNIDSGTLSSLSVTATNVTFGTITNRASVAITGGNDHRHIIHTVPVSSVTGTPNVAATFSYTISASGSGPTAFLRIRARRAAVTNQVYVAPSSNITAGGEATTARLTAPSGKTTSDFVTGRRWDDENGSDAIDLTTDDYTEVEWSVGVQAPAADGDYFDFRVYAGDTPLDTYTVTPRWTIGTPPAFNPMSVVRRPATIFRRH